MGWVRLDDGLCTHIKTFTLLKLDSIGLWTLCLSFCAHELTDGFVPEAFVDARVPSGDPDKTVANLVMAGWLLPCEGGFTIPQYLAYNPSKDETQANRERVSKQRSEAGKRGAQARWGGKANGKTDGKPPIALPEPRHGTLHGPVPIPSSLDKLENVPNPEHVRLAELLAELIAENGSKRPTPSSVLSWSDDVRLMVERDGRTLEQVEAAIRWCQGDDFWRGNVLSMGKLRKQYDKLRLAAQREQQPAEKPKWERAAKVTLLGQDHTCRECETPLTSEQANNQSRMCDEHYGAFVEGLTGEAA